MTVNGLYRTLGAMDMAMGFSKPPESSSSAHIRRPWAMQHAVPLPHALRVA